MRFFFFYSCLSMSILLTIILTLNGTNLRIGNAFNAFVLQHNAGLFPTMSYICSLAVCYCCGTAYSGEPNASSSHTHTHKLCGATGRTDEILVSTVKKYNILWYIFVRAEAHTSAMSGESGGRIFFCVLFMSVDALSSHMRP